MELNNVKWEGIPSEMAFPCGTGTYETGVDWGYPRGKRGIWDI